MKEINIGINNWRERAKKLRGMEKSSTGKTDKVQTVTINKIQEKSTETHEQEDQ